VFRRTFEIKCQFYKGISANLEIPQVEQRDKPYKRAPPSCPSPNTVNLE